MAYELDSLDNDIYLTISNDAGAYYALGELLQDRSESEETSDWETRYTIDLTDAADVFQSWFIDWVEAGCKDETLRGFLTGHVDYAAIMYHFLQDPDEVNGDDAIPHRAKFLTED